MLNEAISCECVYVGDDDFEVPESGMSLAYHTWLHNTDRIVGFSPRANYVVRTMATPMCVTHAWQDQQGMHQYNNLRGVSVRAAGSIVSHRAGTPSSSPRACSSTAASSPSTRVWRRDTCWPMSTTR